MFWSSLNPTSRRIVRSRLAVITPGCDLGSQCFTLPSFLPFLTEEEDLLIKYLLYTAELKNVRMKDVSSLSRAPPPPRLTLAGGEKYNEVWYQEVLLRKVCPESLSRRQL